MDFSIELNSKLIFLEAVILEEDDVQFCCIYFRLNSRGICRAVLSETL